MIERVGPGNTRFIPNKDGSLSLQRWNDPAWRTSFARAEELTGPQAGENITRLLAKAYIMGMEDKASLIRQALT